MVVNSNQTQLRKLYSSIILTLIIWHNEVVHRRSTACCKCLQSIVMITNLHTLMLWLAEIIRR